MTQWEIVGRVALAALLGGVTALSAVSRLPRRRPHHGAGVHGSAILPYVAPLWAMTASRRRSSLA